MRTAIDSSVLLLILKRQTGWQQWQACLEQASSEGPLLICPVVFAECSTGFDSADTALRRFDALQFQFDPILPEAAFLAGQTFLRYRREGGPRLHLIPDFLIAAHASIQADRLAAVDRGYLRRYFGSLPLLA
jgi:hypothetical protein